VAFFVGSALRLCYFPSRLNHVNILEEVQMKIPIDEIKNLCVRILMSHELTEEEATIISDDYLDAEMRGKPSHGLKAFSVVVEDSKNRGKASCTKGMGILAILWPMKPSVGQRRAVKIMGSPLWG
jgi:hypothetical protein